MSNALFAKAVATLVDAMGFMADNQHRIANGCPPDYTSNLFAGMAAELQGEIEKAAAAPAQRWEVKRVSFMDWRNRPEDESMQVSWTTIELMAAEGWELLAVMDDRVGRVAYLRRPAQPKVA